ncbi:MAG TPA: hypothetical protein VGM72_05345 [Micropepsaceae bacterium]|jgi:hypothetical protein
MGPRRSIPAVFRTALILFASLAIANCAAPMRLQPEPRPAKITPPPAAQEIPLQAPIVDVPVANQPEAPQVASNMPRPRPSARRPGAPASSSASVSEQEAVLPSELVGYDFSAVLKLLKKPDMIQNSALSIVWTYSQSDCMLQLYFYPDIQTRIFRLLKYDLKDGTGEKPNDSSACMRHMMVRNDEPALP